MRIIQTYILRLNIDTESPAPLRGTLREVRGERAHTFNNDASLLSLLNQLVATTLSDSTTTPNTSEETGQDK